MTEIARIIQKHRQNGILVDTNIFLLLLVGIFDRALIRTFKRTQQFTEDDFDVLKLALGEFDRIITTPNILTEVSNLAGQLGEPKRQNLFECFRVKALPLTVENVISSQEACAELVFPRLGLTDAAIAVLAKRDIAVLTDDLKLHWQLTENGVDSINFNHIRDL